jgi:hypothetical protein
MVAGTVSIFRLQDRETMIPHTVYERSLLLEEVERGEKVVVPVSVEHAEFMIKVAQDYIENHKRQMWIALQK